MLFIPVAKRKSLFDDKSVEIEELTYIIKQVSGCAPLSSYWQMKVLVYISKQNKNINKQ